MIERKLATIRKIDEIKSIPDADRIETAVLGGWEVVVQKDHYNRGDLVVYCEIDSFLPVTLVDLTPKNHKPKVYNGVEGNVLKTVRLRGQISQGLILSLSSCGDIETEEGMDVTELLGVVKYEKPIPACLSGIAKSYNPSEFPPPDALRIQNITNWTELSSKMYFVTEKAEGSAMSAGLLNNEFIVCTKQVNLLEDAKNSLWIQARRYQIEEKLRAHNLDNIIIQGELVGSKIEGNHYEMKEHDFFVFGIYDVNKRAYIPPLEQKKLVEKLELKHVPIVNERFIPHGMTIQEVLELADGISDLNPNKLREGLVFKSHDGMIQWKAVSNKYLMGEK